MKIIGKKLDGLMNVALREGRDNGKSGYSKYQEKVLRVGQYSPEQR